MLRQFVNGICMALADSVPGVSGGTIAFILGFYDKFIGSINDIIYEKGEKRKTAAIYLIKLGIGWITGMIGAVLVLSNAFERHIYTVSSLFLGFVIASIPLLFREEKESYAHSRGNVIFAFIGAAVVVAITFLNNTSLLTGVSLNSLSVPIMLYVFVAGMVAISAMFLPGISGSTLLLIFGLYMPVISAIKEFLHANLSYMPGLIIFGLGVITGALSVVKGIKVCLDHHRAKTMYAILGLMIGSLYAIVKGPTTLEVPAEELSIANFDYLAFAIGVALVVMLQLVGKNKEEMVGKEKVFEAEE